jgi:hypothetical protein
MSNHDTNDSVFSVERTYLGRWLRILAREKVMSHSLVRQYINYDLEDSGDERLFATMCEYYAACNQLEDLTNRFLLLSGSVDDLGKSVVALSQLEYVSFSSYIMLIESHRTMLKDKYNISLEIN